MSALVTAIAARGPLGLNATQLTLCWRAGKREPRGCGFDDRRGREIGMCRVGGLPDHLWGYDRMLALAAPALRDVLAACDDDIAGAPLVMALPEPDRPDDAPPDANLAADLIDLLEAPLDAERSEVIRLGHAGGAFALERALALLSSGTEAVVVGGVDSYLHPRVLRALDEDYRLDARDVADGFVPSEGAAFLVLTSSASQPIARLVAVETGRESSVAEDEPNLASAMTAMVSKLNAHDPQWIMTDENGERHRLREWRMVTLRQLTPEHRVERMSEGLGDIGAAFGPTLAVVGCELWRLRAAPSPRLMVALHADGSERGAFVLEAGQP